MLTIRNAQRYFPGYSPEGVAAGLSGASIREWAASTMGALKDPRAVPPLLVFYETVTAPVTLRASSAPDLHEITLL